MADLEILEINDEQAQGAKLLASGLSKPEIRKRGMIDMLGISCAVNYLNYYNFKVDTKRSVYKIPLLFEEFKISDIYYKNYRIDVITLYKEKNIKIPRIHDEMDILPNFYLIVQIGAKIKEAKIIGFIEAKNIPLCPHDSKFYYPTLDMIFDIKKFSSMTKHSVLSKNLLGKHVDCMGLFLKFIDGDLSSVYKRQMIQHLMSCDSCRMRFIDTVEFEKLAGNIKFYPELIKKHTKKEISVNVGIELTQKSKFATIEENSNMPVDLTEKSSVAVMEKLENVENNDTDDTENNILDENDDNAEVPETTKNADEPKGVELFDFSDKEKTQLTQSSQSSKKIIDTIFNGIPKIEFPQIKTITNTKNKRVILVSTLVMFIILSFALISIKGAPSADFDETSLDTFEAPLEEDYDNEYSYGGGLYNKAPRRIEDYAIVQQKISKPAYSPSIAKISWEAPQSIVEKDSYKKYLQLAGKNIKLNLQNDLLLVNDIPANKVVKLDIRVSADGDVDSLRMTSSSGSDQIDASIRKVIKETLSYMKPPSHGIISKPIDITLVTELN